MKPPPKNLTRIPTRCALAAIVMMCLVLVGCVPLEKLAPPADERLVPHAQAEGVGQAELAHGRDVYLRHCGACHALQPLDRYSLEQWEEIMPDMVEESKLTGQSARHVTAYVYAARRLADAPAPSQ